MARGSQVDIEGRRRTEGVLTFLGSGSFLPPLIDFSKAYSLNGDGSEHQLSEPTIKLSSSESEDRKGEKSEDPASSIPCFGINARNVSTKDSFFGSSISANGVLGTPQELQQVVTEYLSGRANKLHHWRRGPALSRLDIGRWDLAADGASTPILPASFANCRLRGSRSNGAERRRFRGGFSLF